MVSRDCVARTSWYYNICEVSTGVKKSWANTKVDEEVVNTHSEAANVRPMNMRLREMLGAL